jgi:hypothetical protein
VIVVSTDLAAVRAPLLVEGKGLSSALGAAEQDRGDEEGLPGDGPRLDEALSLATVLDVRRAGAKQKARERREVGRSPTRFVVRQTR